MTQDNYLPGGPAICEDDLASMRYSRFGRLVAHGMDRQAARLFAILEAKQRQQLARQVGADAALLAGIEWIDNGELGLTVKLVLDKVPADLSNRFIADFQLPDEVDEFLPGEDNEENELLK
ncbi:hypothetical protein SAMN05421539_102677 [Jannaschia seohaensis]|uniref:Uncharacterized protein n=2 Tax=Jannaschia seohaensis TaxID=475081 RepID=A0A2Y9ACJ0_9RHOB|nr:hypothetical protein BCF38_102677 [Jannaschia seohaensis]SSA42030.1 hypothetical protein SAMN05421539_102677 [Jannaschia seohaensis]